MNIIMTSTSSVGTRISSLSDSSRSKFTIESSNYPNSSLSLESRRLRFELSTATFDPIPVTHKNKFSTLVNETVTVKFRTPQDESFTKAFRKHETVTDVKNELSRLFCIPVQHICIGKIDDDNGSLHGDGTLIELPGVESTGIAELKLKINGPYKLPNRDLIYGHLPNVDVITVNLARSNLIVEIENHCEIKPWLGGYRNKLTGRLYHHASCQTDPTKTWPSKTCKSVQTLKFQDRSVNTMRTKSVQTHSIPSIDDRIIVARSCIQISTDQPSHSVVQESHNIIANDFDSTKNDRTSIEVHFKTMCERIHRWNSIENKKIDCIEDETERRARRLSVLDRTRKYLSHVNEKKRLVLERMARERQKRKLSEMAIPKTFVATTGERILLDTVENQRAIELHNLYLEYHNKSTVEDKIKTIVNLTTFFERCADFEFIEPFMELLQRELDLRTNGLLDENDAVSLQQRTERYISHYVARLSSSRTREQLRSSTEPETDLQPYRIILRKLQDDEATLFKCFTSMVFRMRADEIRQLVRDIWGAKSIVSENESIEELRMTRWKTDTEWSPWNSILLTKREMKKHMEVTNPEDEYDKCFVSRVRNKHLLAKVTFSEKSSINEIFNFND